MDKRPETVGQAIHRLEEKAQAPIGMTVTGGNVKEDCSRVVQYAAASICEIDPALANLNSCFARLEQAISTWVQAMPPHQPRFEQVQPKDDAISQKAEIVENASRSQLTPLVMFVDAIPARTHGQMELIQMLTQSVDELTENLIQACRG